jgi:hypothetical protein
MERARGGMEKHTFVNQIVAVLEDIDRWECDEGVTKQDMARDVRTRLLICMRAGLVHPFASFYSLEASTVLDTRTPE